MGRLRDRHGAEGALHATHRVGRHPDAELCLDRPDSPASRFHALLTWAGDGWVVRDLGSRNGTVLEGVRLTAGVDVPVRLGDTLQFGGPLEAWTLVDDSPPAAWAEGPERVEARDDILVLPGDTHVVRFEPRAGWVLETAGEIRPVGDGQIVTVDGVDWTLHLPRLVSPTVAAGARPDLSLILRVAGDDVQVEIVTGGNARVLRPRAHHQLLLTLAHERLRARRRGVAEEESGWVSLPDAASYIGITTNVGYVWWYRLREQLEREGAGALVERRFSGELRIVDVGIVIVEGG